MALIRVLGPIDVVDGADAWVPRTPMRRTLLALLALDAPRRVPSDRLLELAWNGRPPRSGTDALRFHIAALRKDVPISGMIESSRGGYRLDADVDMVVFDAVALSLAGGAVDEGRLRDALASWRGPPFVDAGECAVLETEAHRLVEQRAAVIEAYYGGVIDDCRYAEAISELTRCCEEHPLRESMWSLLIDAHHRAGHPADALEHIARLRTNLHDDVGVDLSAPLEALEHKILQQRRDVHARASRPDATRPMRGNLRVPATSFVGRETELDEARSLLTDGARLLTLVGPGGMGKTRLAVELTERLRHDGDTRPRWVVDLSVLDRPDRVHDTVHSTLGLARRAGTDTIDVICDALELAPALVVLDTCESFTEEVSTLVEQVAARCPNTTVIVTSRHTLTTPAGVTREVGPLHPHDAIELFSVRANTTRCRLRLDATNEADVARICARVDHSPLAIELLAARTPTFDLATIIERLDQIDHLAVDTRHGHPGRHESLTTTVEFSYELLDQHEQALFDRLALFIGGFTLDAVEGVCVDDAITGDVVGRLLEQLVEKSLVTVTDDGWTGRRYGLLDTTRTYATHRLATHPTTHTAHLRIRHSTYYAHWVDNATGLLWTDDAGTIRRQCDLELGNIRLATEWACERHDLETALALAAIGGILTWNGRYDEVSWLLEVLELPGVDEHPRAHLVIRELAFQVLFGTDDTELARGLVERGLAIRDHWLLRLALATLERAAARTAPGDEEAHRAAAIEHARRAVDLAGDAGLEHVGAGSALLFLLAADGERTEFYRLWAEHEAAWRSVDGPLRALAANPSGALAVFEPERARQLLEDALPASIEYGMPALTSRLRSQLAGIDARSGDAGRAARSIVEVIDEQVAVGSWPVALGWMRRMVPILTRAGRLDDAVLLSHAITRDAGTSRSGDGALPPDLDGRLSTARMQDLAERSAQMERATLIDWLHDVADSMNA